LQQILSDDGFLHAAGVRLGNPSGAVVDGVFEPITESVVRDLQRRHDIHYDYVGIGVGAGCVGTNHLMKDSLTEEKDT
jgi:peptidoglycan hydrolase-like protein with peptidoglycan-binding domain